MSDVKKAMEDYKKNKLKYNFESPTYTPKKPRLKKYLTDKK